MEVFNDLQFFDDDDVLSTIELEFPNFELLEGVFEGESSQLTASVAEEIPNSSLCSCNNDPKVSTNKEPTKPKRPSSPVDQSRFPLFTEDDINDLQTVAENNNTKRSTKSWMKVLQTWCESRNYTVHIETLNPVDLDKLLSKFYAEIKKVDGEDYEPESLKIMQSAIDRYLKQLNYNYSITRSREFANSQKTLHAKALSLRCQGKGKRPNKSSPLSSEEEEKLWTSGQLGDQNGRALTHANFKNLTEQMGFRGRQDHYDAYVEDFLTINHENGTESIQFTENPTKTRSGGLHIPRRTTPQVMSSTDGGERDPVRLFKLWLSKRPDGMKDNGPLYLQVINRPKKTNIWYGKTRMGQNSIGNIMKTMACNCLSSTKRITNHSMRKTLVQKLKRSGQPRHVIKEITGHARESSLDDYDEVDEEQRKELSHIISGFQVQPSKSNREVQVSTRSNTTPGNTNEGQCLQAITNPPFGMYFTSTNACRMAPFPTAEVPNQVQPLQNYTGCTFNYYSEERPERPAPLKKRRRAVIFDSDDEKEN